MTFCSDPEQVQGIIAEADRRCGEHRSAEDDATAGAGGAKARSIVGTWSGSLLPHAVCVGALWRRGGGKPPRSDVLQPYLQIPPAIAPDIVLAPDLGPEILTGSTRLKAGTATKMLLNMFSTLGMVRAGKVVSNLMVNVKPTNVKLRDRAVRIVQELTGADYSAAERALRASRWVIRAALRRLSA